MLNSHVLPSNDGRLRAVPEEEHIRYSLRAILLSESEQLPSGQSFGCRIRDFLYRPLTTALQLELTQHLKEVITAQEKRVELLNLTVSADPFEKSKLQIDFQYLVKTSNKTQTFRLKMTPEGDSYGYA